MMEADDESVARGMRPAMSIQSPSEERASEVTNDVQLEESLHEYGEKYRYIC